MGKLLNREVRRWIYLVAAAAVPVLIFYGVLDAAAAPLVLPLLLALLNLTPESDEADGEGA